MSSRITANPPNVCQLQTCLSTLFPTHQWMEYITSHPLRGHEMETNATPQDMLTLLETTKSIYSYIHFTIKQSRSINPEKKEYKTQALKMLDGCLKELSSEISKLQQGVPTNEQA